MTLRRSEFDVLCAICTRGPVYHHTLPDVAGYSMKIVALALVVLRRYGFVDLRHAGTRGYLATECGKIAFAILSGQQEKQRRAWQKS